MGKFRSAKEENNFTMLPFSLLIVGAFAIIQEPSRCWIGNKDAPYCGCQLITREHNMIDSTCIAKFQRRIHMMSVASSFILNWLSDSTGAEPTFAWTGFEDQSHKHLHDILWFFEPEECPDLNCEDNHGVYHDMKIPLLGNFNFDISRSVH